MTAVLEASPTLQELKDRTDTIFTEETRKLVLPEPEGNFKEEIAAALKLNLNHCVPEILFRMRTRQAALLGLQPISASEVCVLLNGEEHTKRDSDKDVQGMHQYLGCYDHHTGELYNTSFIVSDYHRYTKSKPKAYYTPPFNSQEEQAPTLAWTIRRGQMTYLNTRIPHGVMRRVLELKELNLFNAFEVFAPLNPFNLWRKSDEPPKPPTNNGDGDDNGEGGKKRKKYDPIVVGCIWDLQREGAGEKLTRKINLEQMYFIAQWD